jgi:phosphopantetheine adenylyltransferase|tara:strand:+ start:214 stop:492 length:279 start_codon:yes stop_codon:yes gene_type:complete
MKRNETKSGRKLDKLKKLRLKKLEEELDNAIRGYDHLLHYKDDCTVSVKDDRVNENIRTIIMKHNYQVQRVSSMLVRDFKTEERLQVENDGE